MQSKIYGYARCSNKEHGEHGSTIEEQEAEIHRYAQGLDGEWVECVHDSGTSGGLSWEDRPVLRELIDRLEPGDHLVVWAISRLSRNIIDGLKCIDYLLNQKEVNVHALDYGGKRLSLEGAMGKAMLCIALTAAELQREAAIESARRRVRYALEHNLPVAGSKWGYRVERRPKPGGCGTYAVYVRDEKEQELMREAAVRYMRGESTCSIQKDWKRRGIRNKRTGKPYSYRDVRTAIRALASQYAKRKVRHLVEAVEVLALVPELAMLAWGKEAMRNESDGDR